MTDDFPSSTQKTVDEALSKFKELTSSGGLRTNSQDTVYGIEKTLRDLGDRVTQLERSILHDHYGKCWMLRPLESKLVLYPTACGNCEETFPEHEDYLLDTYL